MDYGLNENQSLSLTFGEGQMKNGSLLGLSAPYRAMPPRAALAALLVSLCACPGPSVDLAGYDTRAFVVSVSPVRATAPNGPTVVTLALSQREGDCLALAPNVTASVGGRAATASFPGGWVAAPRIGSGGKLQNRECLSASFTLTFAEAAQLDALDTQAVFVVTDASRTLTYEALRPIARRTLTRDGSGTLRPGDAVRLGWAPAATFGTTSGLVLAFGTTDVRALTGAASDSGVVFTIPPDAPVGPATVSVSKLEPSVLRCEGAPTCIWHESFRNDPTPLALEIAP